MSGWLRRTVGRDAPPSDDFQVNRKGTSGADRTEVDPNVVASEVTEIDGYLNAEFCHSNGDYQHVPLVIGVQLAKRNQRERLGQPMMPGTEGSAREHDVASAWVVAFYAPDTGAIVHMHMVVTFKGGRELNEEEAVMRRTNTPRGLVTWWRASARRFRPTWNTQPARTASTFRPASSYAFHDRS